MIKEEQSPRSFVSNDQAAEAELEKQISNVAMTVATQKLSIYQKNKQEKKKPLYSTKELDHDSDTTSVR